MVLKSLNHVWSHLHSPFPRMLLAEQPLDSMTSQGSASLRIGHADKYVQWYSIYLSVQSYVATNSICQRFMRRGWSSKTLKSKVLVFHNSQRFTERQIRNNINVIMALKCFLFHKALLLKLPHWIFATSPYPFSHCILLVLYSELFFILSLFLYSYSLKNKVQHEKPFEVTLRNFDFIFKVIKSYG